MLATRVVKNSTGEHFAFRLRNGLLAQSLIPQRFRDEFQTLSFIRGLKVPNGHWQRLCQSMNHFSYDAWRNAHPWLSIEEYITQCLIKGDVQVFKVKSSEGLRLTQSKRQFKNEHGISYQFIPACQLLTSQPEIKQTTSAEQIQKLLDTLKPSKEQLHDLIKSLEIPITAADSTDTKALTDKLTTSLTKGEVVITVAEEPNKPELEEILLKAATKTLDLGPHETESADKEEQKEEEIICKLKKFTVSCAHDGRKQVVSPKTVGILNLDVVASEKAKRGYEKITATLQTDAPCGTHISSSSSIHPAPAKTIKGSLENTYHLACAPISNPLKVLWLPSIKPTTYKIAARSCENFTPSSVEVNVFPKIKWNVKVGYSFEGNDKGKFSGEVSLKYDEEERKLVADYKKNIETVLQKIDWIKTKIDLFLKKISDGSPIKLELYWPNLNIEYKAELKEDKKSPEVVSSYSLDIAASPLIGMKGSIDIFPVLLKAARSNPAAASIASILEKVVEGVGNENSFASIKADIQLVFSIDTKVSIKFSTSGENGKDNREPKAEQAIGMDFQLEGVIGAKGHVWIIKFEKSYKAGIKTGFVGKVIIERDDKGYFWYSQFIFNGLIVYFTKYEKLEKSITGNDRKKNKYSKLPNQVENSSTKQWTWIEPDPDEGSSRSPSVSNKHYIIKF